MTKEDDEQRILQVVQHVSLRVTHPTLFRLRLTFSLMSLALAINFFFSHPTFNPGGVHRAIIGAVFLMLGASELILLTVYRRMKLLKLVVALSMGVMGAWGLANSQQWDWNRGRASLQLPILYVGLAVIRFILLHEPVVNPVTANGNGKKLKP